MEVGSLNVSFTSNINQLNQDTAKAKTDTDQLAAVMKKLVAATEQLATATEKLSKSRKKNNQEEKDGAGSSANLGRRMRELTTGVLGTNVATIALGTAFGNVLTQAVSRVVLGLVDTVTQFGRLQQELAQVNILMTRTGQEMKFIVEQSRLTGRSLADTSQEWIALANQVQSTGGDLERARFAMVQFNLALSLNRQQTVLGAFGQLGTAFGGLVVRLEGTTGASTGVATSLTFLANILNRLSDALPAPASNLEGMNARLETLRTTLREVESGARTWSRMLPNALDRAFGVTREDRIRRLTAAIIDLEEQIIIASARPGEPARLEARAVAHQHVIEQLQHEVRIGRMTTQEQEVQNRLFQLQMQFRQMGLPLGAQELANLEAQVRAAQALARERRNLTAEAQNAVTALSGIPVAFGNIFTLGFGNVISGLTSLRDGFSSFTTELSTFHTQAFIDAHARMEEAMRRNGATAAEMFSMKRGLLLQEQNLILDTATKVGQAIKDVFPKSKAAAIGQAVINTAVAITRALQFGWPFGWIQAAAVAASGAAQIAAIRSASPAGGNTPSVGGGGGAAGSDQGGMVPQMITVELQRGALFSSEQVTELLALMNDQVRNGGALFATRLI